MALYKGVVTGWAGGARAPPIIWDFAPIQYLLNRKIPIYCVPLQYKFSDYLPEVKTIQTDEGLALKQRIGAQKYYECSAKINIGIEKVSTYDLLEKTF